MLLQIWALNNCIFLCHNCDNNHKIYENLYNLARLNILHGLYSTYCSVYSAIRKVTLFLHFLKITIFFQTKKKIL